ncbi:MAG: redoxin domain-containing protein [Streptosporangiales bacterium]|nr:redoxin domain-containing protein [Streptosporangiales bacterium]
MTPTVSPRRALAAGVCAALFVVAGCTGASGTPTPTSNSENQRYISGTGELQVVAKRDRKPAPTLRGETLDGKQLSTASYRGKVVVLNFWASWCAPCRAEAPALQAVSAKTEADGVQFIGINFKDTRANALAFEREFDVGYPSLYDPPGETALAFRGQLPPAAVPSTIVIDRTGRVAARIIGQTTYTRLLRVVRRVAAE